MFDGIANFDAMNLFCLCDVILRVGLVESVFDVILRKSSTLNFWLSVYWNIAPKGSAIVVKLN